MKVSTIIRQGSVDPLDRTAKELAKQPLPILRKLVALWRTEFGAKEDRQDPSMTSNKAIAKWLVLDSRWPKDRVLAWLRGPQVSGLIRLG